MSSPEPTCNEVSPKITLSRRRLLKALAAAGGGIAATTLLPARWLKPLIEVGVLPAHAQVSGPTQTPTSTPTPTNTPTYTPTPPRPGILGCTARGLIGEAADWVCPNDSIVSSVDIIPNYAGVHMRRTIDPVLTLGQDGGNTDANGHLDSPLFDLSPFDLPYGATITVEYDFDDPQYPGLSDPCTNQLVVMKRCLCRAFLTHGGCQTRDHLVPPNCGGIYAQVY